MTAARLRDVWLRPKDSPILNVVRGGFLWDEPAGLLVRGGVAADTECLTTGPLPPIENLRDWLNARADHWEAAMPPPRHRIPRKFQTAQVMAAADRAEVVRIWCGTGGCDWLSAAFWTHLLVREEWATGRVELVSVEQVTWSSGRRRAPISMGEVSDQSAAEHLPGEPLAPNSIAKLLAAWKAATAATPEPAAAFASGAGRWPLLRRAVGFLLDRLPSAETGLPVWDERLLQAVVGGERRVPRLIGEMLRVRDRTGDDPGDLWLWSRLRRLVEAPDPLVTLRRVGPHGMNFEATATAAGRSVADGERPAIRSLEPWTGGDSTTPSFWEKTDANGVRQIAGQE